MVPVNSQERSLSHCSADVTHTGHSGSTLKSRPVVIPILGDETEVLRNEATWPKWWGPWGSVLGLMPSLGFGPRKPGPVFISAHAACCLVSPRMLRQVVTIP